MNAHAVRQSDTSTSALDECKSEMLFLFGGSGTRELKNASNDAVIEEVIARGLDGLFRVERKSGGLSARMNLPDIRDSRTDTRSPEALPSVFVTRPSATTDAPAAGIEPFHPHQVGAALLCALTAFDPWDETSRDFVLDRLTCLHAEQGPALLHAIRAFCLSTLSAEDHIILLLDWIALVDEAESRTERAALLLAFLGDSSPDVRLAALSGLEWLRFAPAGALLRKSAQEERIPSLRKAMSEAALTVEG